MRRPKSLPLVLPDAGRGLDAVGSAVAVAWPPPPVERGVWVGVLGGMVESSSWVGNMSRMWAVAAGQCAMMFAAAVAAEAMYAVRPTGFMLSTPHPPLDVVFDHISHSCRMRV